MLTLDQIDSDNLSPSKLGQLLIDAKKAYYTGGRPIMDDHTYDTLEEILRQKSPNHRFFTKIGHPNFDTGWDKKPHQMFMGSQNKVTNIKDLIHYFELKKSAVGSNVDMQSISYVVQPKCDGISLEIIYKNGKLIEAITRGDSLIGDVITQNVVKMKNVVVSLPNHFSGSVRCEIVVTKKDFAKLPETYSNPRNAASGLSQRLDSLYSEYCSLIAVDISENIAELEKNKLLKSLGFTPIETHFFTNFDQIEKFYQKILTDRINYPFDIDGLVIKINDPNISRNLGIKNNRPQHQVAYKFPADSNQTQIKSINWQVGPMGTITPVGEIEPVEISGAIINFASLGNYDLVKNKNLNIGDIIEISRRGDVIPHIEKVITKVSQGHAKIPINCPSCNTLLVVEDKYLKCPNSAGCPAQILGSLRLFCSTLDILGLSDKTISKLYLANRIKLPGDFFKLSVDDIKDLDNLGEKSAQNIINQIQAKKMLSLVEAFDAAIIPNFSRQRIKQLIKAGFDTPQKLLNISFDQIEQLPGFQKTLAQKIIDGIALRRPWIESILSQINLKFVIRNLKLNNLSFCITGSLSVPRQQLVDQIESNGGTVSSSVSKNTDFLICNQSSNSDKYQTAIKLGVTIINENEFNHRSW